MSAAAFRILMIEDNEQNAYLARYLLEQAGHGVAIYRTGREGFAAAVEQRPDLVLLDIQLPDLDGYAIARKFREESALRGIPLVAVSSFAMPGEKARAREAGCVGYIEKPIRPLHFVAQVEAFLARGRTAS